MDPIAIDPASDVPPFEQLRSQLARRIARGELAPGTRIETVRRTAADLGLAVNTVARAYRELEADGVLVTRGRQGTFVRSAILDDPSTGSDGDARAAAAGYVRTARRLGLARAEAVLLVEQLWD